MLSSNRRIVVAVDGGIHRTKDGMTGGVGMIVFRLQPVAPKSKRVPVESISVRGRYFGPNPKDPITNNKMELIGFSIMATELVDELWDTEKREWTQPVGPLDIEFWSDSQYALGILFRPDWTAKKNKMLVQNAKKELEDLATVTTVSGKFIRGHKGHFINEFADLVAALSLERKKDIAHELLFKDIEDTCLFCDLFPCQGLDGIGLGLIKKWGDRFKAIQTHGYGPPCANRKEYDAEWTLTKTAVDNAAKDSAGSRS